MRFLLEYMRGGFCFHNNFGGDFKLLPEVLLVKKIQTYQYIIIFESEPGPGLRWLMKM